MRTEAVHTSAFWLIIIFSLLAATASLFNTTGYSYFCEIGIDPIRASYLMSAASGILIGSKVLLGAVCDRFGAKTGTLFTCVCFFLAYALALSAANLHFLALPTVFFFGLGNSVTTVALPLIVSELFGEKDYSSLIGIFFAGNFIGSGLGPVLASSVFDHTGSYAAAMWLAILLTLGLIVITLLIYLPGAVRIMHKVHPSTSSVGKPLADQGPEM